jgi:hypothetical protein
VERREDGDHVIALIPRHIETDPDGTEVWAVEAGTERNFEERRRKRGEKIRAVGRPLGELRVTEVHYGIGLESATAWGRFVAKVILGVASLSLPISWLDSTDAQRLRCCFEDRPQPDGERFPMPLDALEQDRGAPPWSLLVPDHLLQLSPREGGGTRFILALFGYLGAQVDLPETPCPEGGCAWIVPSDRRPPGWYSLPALDVELKGRI